MNYKQLTFAREYRGYSQTDLAAAISGISQSNLSKFEKGFDTLSTEAINKLIDFLNFPKAFFNKKINTIIENANYRKRATVSKSDILKFENKCKLVGYVVDEFSASIDWPPFTLTPLSVEDGYTPQHIAQYTRRQLGITPDEPIRNVFNILERSGIIVYEVDFGEKFDGISYVSDKGSLIIIINKNFPNDRKRFTLAHELGHILMHNENNFPISSYRNKEAEANAFASEFLMPAQYIRNSLQGLKMGDLAHLKSYWLTSMSSIIRRAKDLNCIDEKRYKFFQIELSRYGYTKTEPYEPAIDQPTCFKNAVSLFKDKLDYSVADFSQFTSLPEDIIIDLLSINRVMKFSPFNNN